MMSYVDAIPFLMIIGGLILFVILFNLMDQ